MTEKANLISRRKVMQVASRVAHTVEPPDGMKSAAVIVKHDLAGQAIDDRKG